MDLETEISQKFPANNLLKMKPATSKIPLLV